MSNEEIKALESVATKRKPTRVKKFKEEYINENAVLRQENHALKCKVDKLEGRTVCQLFGLLVKAIVGKKEVGT